MTNPESTVDQTLRWLEEEHHQFKSNAFKIQQQLEQLQQFLPMLEQAAPPQDYAGILKSVETNRSLRDRLRIKVAQDDDYRLTLLETLRDALCLRR